MLAFIIVWLLASLLISVLLGKMISVGSGNKTLSMKAGEFFNDVFVLRSRFSS